MSKIIQNAQAYTVRIHGELHGMDEQTARAVLMQAFTASLMIAATMRQVEIDVRPVTAEGLSLLNPHTKGGANG